MKLPRSRGKLLLGVLVVGGALAWVFSRLFAVAPRKEKAAPSTTTDVDGMHAEAIALAEAGAAGARSAADAAAEAAADAYRGMTTAGANLVDKVEATAGGLVDYFFGTDDEEDTPPGAVQSCTSDAATGESTCES